MIESYDEERRNAYAMPTHMPAPDMFGNNLSGVAKIKVVGVGGAGNNAVDRLIESGLKSAEYIVVNTDNQALARSKASNRIQIGVKLTKGLGAGADPVVGKAAAEENKEAIQNALRSILRNNIIETCLNAEERGYIPLHDVENLNDMFASYEALDGNGTTKQLYEKTIKLPHKG
jgi:hypothetical protein